MSFRLKVIDLLATTFNTKTTQKADAFSVFNSQLLADTICNIGSIEFIDNMSEHEQKELYLERLKRIRKNIDATIEEVKKL